MCRCGTLDVLTGVEVVLMLPVLGPDLQEHLHRTPVGSLTFSFWTVPPRDPNTFKVAIPQITCWEPGKPVVADNSF